MGNINSLIQKIRGVSAQKMSAGSESDDDDEEHWEVEYDKSNGSSRDCKTDHEKYIPIEDLLVGTDSLGLLPEEIRHESVLEYIRIHEKLVVRIRVNARKSGSGYSFFGTGCATISTTKEEVEEFRECPLLDCGHNDGQAHQCYGGLLVYTNKHNIGDHGEAQNCCVDFFYYNEKSLPNDDNTGINRKASDDSSLTSTEGHKHEAQQMSLDIINNSSLHKGVITYGNSLRENMQHKDLVGLRIVYHDRELYMTVKKYIELTSKAWSNIPEKFKATLKKRVIIISHPHGWPKQISFGHLISLEDEDKMEKHRKVTRYNAATCKGSSGAPVLTGHYPYRPFVHSSKAQFGASFSY